MYIEPGSPWENGYCESFNSKLRDEFLNGEIFYSIQELRILAESWRFHYNNIRPHSSLGYRAPAPEAWLTNFMGHGEVETATRFPLPTRRLSELRNIRATLTQLTAQTSGNPARMLDLPIRRCPINRIGDRCTEFRADRTNSKILSRPKKPCPEESAIAPPTTKGLRRLVLIEIARKRY